MKLLRFATVALLTGALVVACDDDDGGTPVTPVAPAPIVGTVSGTVSVEGSGLPGVSVNLVGSGPQSETTGSSGGYSFDNVPAGTHGVQISGAPAEVAFVETAKVVTITTSGQTATADFSGNYIRTSDISGTVLTAGGEGVVATVTATGGGMLMSEEAVIGTSGTDGDFILPGLRAGTYHVTISDFGDHEFTVTSRDVTVGVGQSAPPVAFTAEAVPEPEVTTGSISGTVLTAGGEGVVATVTAVGTGEDGVTVSGTSDTEGDYELPEVEAGDYTVTISDFGDHEFTVTSRPVTVVAGEIANASFEAEAEAEPPEPEVTTGSISGTVLTAGGEGVVATVTAVGTGEGEDGVTVSGTSDTEGDYELPEVEAGDYTVTISDFGDHEFTVTSRPVTVVAGEIANASFEAEAEAEPPEPEVTTGSISGEVVTAGGEGVVATVTAVGTGEGEDGVTVSGTSDTEGDYELPEVEAGDYTVTISDFGDHEFTVTSRPVTVVAGEIANASFKAEAEDAEADEAFVLISDVSFESDDDDTGRLTVKVSVERGEQRFEQLSLYVDGEVVATQPFGLAPAPAEPAEKEAQAAQQQQQQVFEFTLGFDTDEYDPVTGDPAYPNGPYNIVAGLTVSGSTEEVFSNRMEVEFANTDGVHVAVNGLTRLPVLGEDGGYWYGGPGAGFDLTAFPVVYSGRSVASVTLGAGFCGPDSKAASADAAPYDFSPNCDGYEGPVDIDIFSIGAAKVETLNAGDEVFSVQLDYKGPTAPMFNPNVNGREEGWINDGVDLTDEYNADDNEDGWLTYGAAGGGGGGYTAWLRSSSTKPATVDAALEASRSSALPGPSMADAYCFIASATDLLGNESALPEEEAECMTAAAYETAVDDYQTAVDEINTGSGTDEEKAEEIAALATVAMPVALRAGVDITAPEIEFDGGLEEKARITTVTVAGEFTMSVSDGGSIGNSGARTNGPVSANLRVRSRSDDDEADLPAEDPEETTATVDNVWISGTSTMNLADLTDAAYYTLTASAVDKAGNSSEPISRTVVRDNMGATVGSPSIPATINTNSFAASAFLSDDLSIRDYYWTVGFSATVAGITSPMVRLGSAHTVVDEFNADDLTHTNYVVNTPITTVLRLQAATNADGAVASTATNLNSVNLKARDQTGAYNTEGGLATAAPTVTDIEDFTVDDFRFVASTGDEPVICAEGIEDGGDDCEMGTDESITLEAVASKTASTFANPFSRVDFYYRVGTSGGDLRLIDSDIGAASSSTTTGGVTTRTWTYELDVTGNDLFTLVEDAFTPDADTDIDGTVFAFGVNDDGTLALVADGVDLAIDPQED